MDHELSCAVEHILGLPMFIKDSTGDLMDVSYDIESSTTVDRSHNDL